MANFYSLFVCSNGTYRAKVRAQAVPEGMYEGVVIICPIIGDDEYARHKTTRRFATYDDALAAATAYAQQLMRSVE